MALIFLSYILSMLSSGAFAAMPLDLVYVTKDGYHITGIGRIVLPAVPLLGERPDENCCIQAPTVNKVPAV